MSRYHCVVWIDRHEAHVIQFDAERSESQVIHATDRGSHQHHERGVIGAGKAPPDIDYFRAIAEAAGGSGEILVAGPSRAKLEFVAYLRGSLPAVAARVVGVEPIDHPAEGELVRFARRFCEAKDRLPSQT